MFCWLKGAGGLRKDNVPGVTSGERLLNCKPPSNVNISVFLRRGWRSWCDVIWRARERRETLRRRKGSRRRASLAWNT